MPWSLRSVGKWDRRVEAGLEKWVKVRQRGYGFLVVLPQYLCFLYFWKPRCFAWHVITGNKNWISHSGLQGGVATEF